MTVLQHQRIKGLIELYHIIENYDLDNIGPASYELRIGSALSPNEKRRYDIAIGEEFVIRPNSHVLLGTLEKVKMPNNMIGTMFLKSRFGRGGFIPWGQGMVDPGYEGSLTMSLVNLTQYPQILKGGDKVCHLIFQNLEGETERPYDGVYKGSEGAIGPAEKPMKVFGDVVNAAISGVASGLAQGAITG
jgi:dCTP deaminase